MTEWCSCQTQMFFRLCSWHLAIITQFNGQQMNENIIHATRPIQRQTKTCIVAGQVRNDLWPIVRVSFWSRGNKARFRWDGHMSYINVYCHQHTHSQLGVLLFAPRIVMQDSRVMNSTPKSPSPSKANNKPICYTLNFLNRWPKLSRGRHNATKIVQKGE